MQVEQKRACGSCGSENAPDAGFCWRCLVPFASLPTSAPVPGSPRDALPPAPLPWSPVPQHQEANKASKPSKVVRTIVSLIAAAVDA